MIEEVVKVNTGESTRTVKELRKELKDLKDQLLNTQQGTEEYSKTMQKAANIQKELKDQMQEINNSAMDFGQKMGNATKAMAGISGAITAATGALSLFGIQNDEAQKKITATMTTLIGITQGLSKIDDGVKAFKRLTIAINASSKSMNGFKTALLASGIGALVVVLGSVIAYWDEFTAAIGLSAEKMEHLGDIARGVFNVFTSSLKGLAQALGKMIKGDFKGAWQSLKDGFSIVKNFNEGVAASEAKREEERTKKLKEEAAKRKKIAEDEAKARIDAAAKLAKYERDMEQAKLRGSDSEKYSKKNREIQEKYFEKMLSIYKKDSDEYKAVVLEKEQWLQDWQNHVIAELEKEEQALEDERLKEEQILQERKEKEHQNRLDILDDFRQSLFTEQDLLDQRYRILIDAATKEGQDTLAIKDWYEKEKTKIVQEQAEEQKMILQEQIRTYETFAGNIGDILGSMSDMMAEGTEEQKALATASVLVQTLSGVASALAMTYTTHTGWWDWALGISQAAAIATSGAASIKKINEVKPSNSSTYSTGTINMPSVVIGSQDFTQTIDGAMTQTAIQDTRVYVLEHDISETQNKVRVNERRASY